MKDKEFIALLNLYIDGEISPADAARLETEVRGDPRRHQVYRQYCQMHRAGRILAEEFRAAEASGARKVAPLAEAAGRRRTPALVMFGTLAAAAAVAALLVLRPASRAPLATGSAVAVRSDAAPLTAAPAPSPEPARGGIVQRPLLAADTLNLGVRPAHQVTTVSSQSLGWIDELNFAPVPARVAIDELRFDQRPPQLRPEARMISTPRVPAEAPTEMSAFRFVK